MKKDKKVQERKVCLPEPWLLRRGYYTTKQDAMSPDLKEHAASNFF